MQSGFAVDVSGYHLYRTAVFPEAQEDPILPLHASDGRYARGVQRIVSPECIEAEFLGLGRIEFRYQADMSEKKIKIQSYFKTREDLLPIASLSLDFDPGVFDRKEAIFWGWLGRGVTLHDWSTETYANGNPKHSFYFRTQVVSPSQRQTSPLLMLVNSEQGPASQSARMEESNHSVLLIQKIQEAKKALLLRHQSQTYDSATSGPGSKLYLALEQLEAAYQRLQAFAMLSLSDAYSANDERLAAFFGSNSLLSRADILKRLSPHDEHSLQDVSQLAPLLRRSAEGLSASLEQPLIALLNEYSGRTGHAFFDEIVGHLNEAKGFYEGRIKTESYRDVFEAHSETQRKYEQASALLGVIKEVLSERLSPGMQRAVLEEIQLRVTQPRIASPERGASLEFFPSVAQAAGRSLLASSDASDDESEEKSSEALQL